MRPSNTAWLAVTVILVLECTWPLSAALADEVGGSRSDDRSGDAIGEPAGAQTTIGDDAALPWSNATRPIDHDPVVIRVDRDRISVNQEPLITLTGGRIPEHARISESRRVAPAIIVAVEDALLVPQRWARLGRVANFGATLLVHREVPCEVVAEVMLSASVGGVTDFDVGVAQLPFAELWSSRSGEDQGRLVGISLVSPPSGEAADASELPRLQVRVTDAGFILSDLLDPTQFEADGLALPLAGCSGVVAVCHRPEATSESAPVDRFDYRGLYNRLVEVKRSARWMAASDDPESARFYLSADGDIPWEVIVRTMDVARNYLSRDRFDDDESFRAAMGGGELLFDRPVLILSGGSPPATDSEP